MQLILRLQDLLDKTRAVDFLGPLALRIYLAPIFILAGYGKLSAFESTTYYFGEYLGMPFPELMVVLAGGAELIGGCAILLGVAMRWFVIPLMFTMIVAAVTAHWDNGWHVLPETQLTVPWEWKNELIQGALERKEMAKSILKEHGNYEWLTETGPITILKNGIEFAATYFIMLLVLFFYGAGRIFSVDYWLARKYNREIK